MEKKEEGSITPETFKKIFQEFIPYSIKLNWRGEPLMNWGLPYMVKYAKDKGVHEVSFNTNGLLLTQANMTRLAYSGLDWIIISVDGATKLTYEKIRIGGNFERLVKNIVSLNRIFSGVKNPPKIRIQICEQPLNKHEIKDWKELFSRLSDKLRIGHLFNPQGKGNEEVIQPKSCNQPWQRMMVAWNGDMFPCCSDFLGRVNLGNIETKSIHEAWHSYEMNLIRETLAESGRKDIYLCKNCSSYC